ncbi:MAG: glutaminyl-peptide cyclotransferase, partial [Flavobacteriaceae bacterium]
MKWMSLLLSLVFLKACGDSDAKPKITLKPNANTYVAGDTLKVQLKHKKSLELTQVQYFLDDSPIALPYVFTAEKLGDHRLSATALMEGREVKAKERSVRLLKSSPPELWTYSIVNEYPHDPEAYTQGLEFDGEDLYESTGLKGKSSLRKVDYKSGEPTVNKPLDKSYFGEGLTLFNEKIYQLTWQENTAFVYDKNSLDLETSFCYDHSKEGWGLCIDGEYLYKSDGSAKIWRLDPATGKELDYIEATTHKTILTKINELEWVNGKINAKTNQKQKELCLLIKPKTGENERVN